MNIHGKICRCCGGKIAGRMSPTNVNVCVACEQLLDDDSPQVAALFGSAAAAANADASNEQEPSLGIAHVDEMAPSHAKRR